MEIFSLVGKIALDGKAAVENALKEIDAQAKELSGRLEKVGSAFSAAGKKMTDVGKNLSKKVTAPLVGLGVVATKLGMDFEAAMSEVGAISGATGEDLAKLEALAKEMGATTKFSASEAAEGLKYMAMAGWDTQQMLDGLPGVLSLAAASGEDLGQVSDIVTDALTAFGMQASEAGEFADILAAASSNANTNVGMLGESFKYVAPVFGALGYSAEDAALALGLMANAGIKASQAGTSLRGAITRMMKPSKEAAELIDELGLKLTDAEGNMLPFRDIMDQLRSTFANLTAEQQAQYAATIFGQEAMSGMLAIINASEEDYTKLSDAINNSTGAAQQMAAEMQDNLAGRLTELKSALEGLALQIYDVMLPALEGFVAIVQRVVDWLAQLSPGMQSAIVVVGALAAAIGPVLVVLGSMANGISAIIGMVTKLTPLLPVLKGAIAALTGPIGLVIAAIAAAVAIGWYLYENWEEVKELVTQLWEGFKEFWVGLWEGLKAWFSELINAIANYYIDRWNELYNKFQEILNKLRDFFTEAWERIRDIGIEIWEGFRDGVLGIWRGIVDGIKGFINLIIRAVNSMVKRINRISFSIPDWVPVLGGKSWGFNLPTIPELADGGIIRREGLALVGEAGPELLELPQGAKVKPLTGESIDYDRLEAIAYASFYDAFVNALKTLGKGELRINIDGRTLAREMIPRIIAENQRMGVVIT